MLSNSRYINKNKLGLGYLFNMYINNNLGSYPIKCAFHGT